MIELPPPLIRNNSKLAIIINKVAQSYWIPQDIKLMVLTIISFVYDAFNSFSLKEIQEQINDYVEVGKINDEDKVAIVTGATSGLGLATFKALVEMGYSVVLASIDEVKAQQIQRELLLNKPDAKVCFIKLNLSELKSVYDFTVEFKSKFNRLDLLINNAGIMYLNSSITTQEGLEQHFQVNYLGHFLLVELLFKNILKWKTKIAFVGSLVHWGVNKFNVNMFSPHYFDGSSGYCNSKFAIAMYASYLQREHGLDVVVCDPGTINSNLFHMSDRVKSIMSYFMRPVEAGLITMLKGIHDKEGFYYMQEHSIPPHVLIYDRDHQNELVQYSKDLSQAWLQ